MKPQYVIGLDGLGDSEIILKLAPREALYVAQRILNQLDLRQPTTVSLILTADVRQVADLREEPQ